MARCNGTQQWAPRPLHPAMHSGATSNAQKWFVALPPLLEVRTPIAIAIWGKMDHLKSQDVFPTLKMGIFQPAMLVYQRVPVFCISIAVSGSLNRW